MTVWKRLAYWVRGGPLQRRRWYLIVSGVVALAVTIALLYPLLSARWSLIDDHETLAIYDSSPTHGPLWILQELHDTETVSLGASSRYRPVYYVLRLTETALWHGSARLWWFAHIVQFALVLLFTLWALRRLTSIWESTAVVIWMAGAFVWWGDIFCRLGPSESYVAVGLALYAWGAISALQTMRSGLLPRYHRWCGAAIAIGGCIAAGSKENMVFLLVPSIYLAARARWRGSRKWIAVGSAIQVLFGIFIAIGIYLGVSRHGHVYKEVVSANSRAHLMWVWFCAIILDYRWRWLALIVVVSAVFYAAKDKRWLLANELALPAATIVLLCGAWLMQVGFYNVWPPKIGRYYFPGGLAYPAALFVGYVAAVRAARLFEARGVVVLRIASLLFVIWQLFHLDYRVHAQAVRMKNTSTDTSSKLRRITKAARATPTAPIVIVSNMAMAYEYVDAIQINLRHDHITNPVYMVQRFASRDFPEGSLERSITEEMETAAREGGKGVFPLTKPFAYREDGGPCIGVGVGGGTDLKECPALAIFWGPDPSI